MCYSTDDALLRKAFSDILNCCDTHFTYILIHMANLLNEFITTNSIKVTSKLHKILSTTGFVKKALHYSVTPTFPKIGGQFLNNKDQLDAEQKLMISHLTQHDLKLKEITIKHRTLGQELVKK